MNRYAYTHNDPVNFTDPSGLNMSVIGIYAYACIGYGEMKTCGYYQVGVIYLGEPGGGEDGGPGDLGGGGPGSAPENIEKNPSCSAFVDKLIQWLNDSSTRYTLGAWMINQARKGSYEGKTLNKNMPGGEKDRNGFKESLVAHGQRGDVYRHIMFVAGATLSRDYEIRADFMRVDQRQMEGGRAESIAEVAGNKTGVEVGILMDQAADGKLNNQDLSNGLLGLLCDP